MSSLPGKAMLPAAAAIAMLTFMGILSAGPVPIAHAVEGDVCQVYTNAPSQTNFDGQGNNVYVVDQNNTYGVVFRIEDDSEMTLTSGVHSLNGDVVSTQWEETDLTGKNTEVRMDSETGSARITSKAEILDLEEQERDIPDSGESDTLDVPDVDHTLVQPGVGDQVVDTMSPRFFNDADGHPLDNIGDWLIQSGYPDFVGEDGAAPDVCGNDTTVEAGQECGDDTCDYTSYLDDSWGFFDFKCIEAGYFQLDILTPDDTEETGKTLKFFCGGQADTATISAQPTKLETNPVGKSVASSIVTVAVEDQFGDRIDGVQVLFMTDNCLFSNPQSESENDLGISPAGGGKVVTVFSDTDSDADAAYLSDNPLEHSAGTAEVSLDCATGTPGKATVTAVVDRPGSDIVLTQEILIVGPTSATGLTLQLTPGTLQCGETVLAEVTAVDDTGTPVSDGSPIGFTTDTSSGVVGGTEGAQGHTLTQDGKASVHIATDPGNPGTHTVVAYAIDTNGSPTAMTSKTYKCEGAVAAAPPPTTGAITPPSTGDAGLADRPTGGMGLIGIVAAATLAMVGLMAIRLARR